MSAGREELTEGVLLDDDGGVPTEFFESRPTPIPDDSPTMLSEPKHATMTAKAGPMKAGPPSASSGGEVGLGHALYQTRLMEEQRDDLRRLAVSYEGLVRMIPAQPDRATVRRREVSGMLGIVALVAVLIAVAFCAGVGVGGGW